MKNKEEEIKGRFQGKITKRRLQTLEDEIIRLVYE